MKHHPINVLVLVTLIAGCGSAERHESTRAEPTTALKSSKSQDAAVLDLVLTDLLTFDGKDSPRSTRIGEKDRLLVTMTPSSYPRSLEQVLLQRNNEAWAALPPDKLADAKLAAADLIRRHQERDHFAPFEPRDQRIKVQTALLTTKPMSRIDDRPVNAWSPGYSRNGEFAVVNLSIPWSMHHADGIYLLEMRGGAWTIVLRDFIYYV